MLMMIKNLVKHERRKKTTTTKKDHQLCVIQVYEKLSSKVIKGLPELELTALIVVISFYYPNTFAITK